MVLFIIGLLTLIMLAVMTILVVSTTGTIGIILFADVIVCGFLIAWIIKKVADKKNNDDMK